jgi:hypothetical protein
VRDQGEAHVSLQIRFQLPCLTPRVKRRSIDCSPCASLRSSIFLRCLLLSSELARDPARSIPGGHRDDARAASDICDLIPGWEGR